MSDERDVKTLLPEVLPAPEVSSTASPRDRVRERMHTLARRAVIVGGIAVTMSCVACDPVAPPADSGQDAGTE